MSPEPNSTLLDPYGTLTQEPADVMSMDTTSEFFAPPLPFNDLLSSMNDSSIMGVPGKRVPLYICMINANFLCEGFAWMSTQQPEFQLGFYPSLTTA